MLPLESDRHLGTPPQAPPTWVPPTVNGILSAVLFALPAPLLLLAPVPLFLAHHRRAGWGGPWASGVGLTATTVFLLGITGVAPSAGWSGPSVAAGLGGYVAGAILPATLLAWAAMQGPDSVGAVTRAVGAYLVILAGAWVLLEMMAPEGAYGLAYRWVGESISAVIAVAEEAGSTTTAARVVLADLVARKAWYQRWTAALMPALFVMMVVVGMWLNMLYARWLWKGDGRDDDFCAFRMPLGVVYGFMACTAAVVTQVEPLAGWLPQSRPLLIAALNGMLVLGVLYWLQGIAVANHYFFRLKLSPGVRILGIGLQAVLISRPITSVAFAATGLADAWFDLRRLEASEENDGEGR